MQFTVSINFQIQGGDNSTELVNYNTGVQMGCWGLTIYSVAMIVFSSELIRCFIVYQLVLNLKKSKGLLKILDHKKHPIPYVDRISNGTIFRTPKKNSSMRNSIPLKKVIIFD